MAFDLNQNENGIKYIFISIVFSNVTDRKGQIHNTQAVVGISIQNYVRILIWLKNFTVFFVSFKSISENVKHKTSLADV